MPSNAEKRALIATALNEALATRVIRLFEALCSAENIELGLIRFSKGMTQAMEAYEAANDPNAPWCGGRRLDV
jgi:hypothetical protein